MNFARLAPEEAKAHRPCIAVLDEHNRVVRCEGGDINGAGNGTVKEERSNVRSRPKS
jgi:aspartate 1-decarboxylase